MNVKRFTGADTNRDIWILPLDLSDPERPKPGKSELVLASPGADVDAAFAVKGDVEENEQDIGESHGKDTQSGEKRDGNEFRHKKHVKDRQASIQRINLATHGIGQCRGIAGGPDKKHEASLRRLQIVDVDIRGWGLIHLAVPHVADDSDHLRSIIKAALSNSDGFSDRILIWPKPARGGFVDEHDFRSSHTIGVRKQAAFDEGNAHGLEKLRYPLGIHAVFNRDQDRAGIGVRTNDKRQAPMIPRR